MNRRMLRGGRETTTDDDKNRWATLVENDVIGIDSDIDRLIGLYQAMYGYTRNRANAELVRRLSSLTRPDAARPEDSCCS